MAVSKEAEEVVVEEQEEECPKCPAKGAPAWMATFADMATLLMAFFVLILSFADISVLIKDIISDLAIKEASKDFRVLSFIKFLFFELLRSAYDVASAI